MCGFCMACLSVTWFCFVFFFKQKTAYEMRISDWSSDVCSSDLAPCKAKDKPPRQGWQIFEGQNFEGATTMTTAFKNRKTFSAAICAALLFGATMILSSIGPARASNMVAAESTATQQTLTVRSEEHTSELQSLMRISYAVFCLKKKTRKNNNQH